MPLVNVRPLPWFPLLTGFVTLVVGLLTVKGGFGSNVVAAIVGLFISIVCLGVARGVERGRSSGGSYTEWDLVSASTLVTAFTVASWLGGMANVFFVAKELTR